MRKIFKQQIQQEAQAQKQTYERDGSYRKTSSRRNPLLKFLFANRDIEKLIPYILYTGALGAIYITNGYSASEQLRTIKHLNKEVEVIQTEYKTRKIEYSELSIRKGIKAKTDSIGLKTNNGSIKKIYVR